MSKAIFLTGSPGIGKTTVLMKAVDTLKKKGYRVGGMISSEVRIGDSRVGFEIIDLLTGQRGMLAHINQREGPQVSKYRVNLHDLAQVGARAIARAAKEADVVCCDEVGPMELYSPIFKETVKKVLDSGKPMLGTIHSKAMDPLIDSIKSRTATEIIEVTFATRHALHEVVASKIIKALSPQPSIS